MFSYKSGHIGSVMNEYLQDIRGSENIAASETRPTAGLLTGKRRPGEIIFFPIVVISRMTAEVFCRTPKAKFTVCLWLVSLLFACDLDRIILYLVLYNK